MDEILRRGIYWLGMCRINDAGFSLHSTFHVPNFRATIEGSKETNPRARVPCTDFVDVIL